MTHAGWPPDALLLDTHVLIWYTQGDRAELSPSCVVELDAARAGGRLVASAMSVREFAMLEARGRIGLAIECGAWVERSRREYHVRYVPLEAEVAIASTRLPGVVQRDPIDQMLVATARHYGWRLVTRDRAILDYASHGYVKALDAGRGRAVGEPRRRPRAR
ncbi:MAG: type II toxin-antitoxin system VapC family toxin [Gemmatimonadota bacterium]